MALPPWAFIFFSFFFFSFLYSLVSNGYLNPMSHPPKNGARPHWAFIFSHFLSCSFIFFHFLSFSFSLLGAQNEIFLGLIFVTNSVSTPLDLHFLFVPLFFLFSFLFPFSFIFFSFVHIAERLRGSSSFRLCSSAVFGSFFQLF